MFCLFLFLFFYGKQSPDRNIPKPESYGPNSTLQSGMQVVVGIVGKDRHTRAPETPVK